MAQTVTFDVQRLIAEVAARHRLLLKPDDAAFAIVTMNRLVLEESIEALHARIQEDLSAFESAAQKLQKRSGSVVAAQVRESAAGIREELQRDIKDASLQASKIVREAAAVYQKPWLRSRLITALLAAILLFLCGAWIGRVSAQWWPLLGNGDCR